MQSSNKIFDDLAKLAGSSLGLFNELRRELDVMLKQQFEHFAARVDMVSRDEFEAVKKLASKARQEQEVLEKRLEVLEKKLQPKAVGSKKANSTTSKAKKTTKKKSATTSKTANTSSKTRHKK